MINPTALESKFTNQYGERFVLRSDPSLQSGELLGDETDWKPIQIQDDTVRADFLFSPEEWHWLSEAWRELTGRTIRALRFK